MLFQDEYVPEHYANCLLAKVDNLKQGSSTVKKYYPTFKICVIFGGLEECGEDNMSRFMKGLNSEIRTLLIRKSYNNIRSLFGLLLVLKRKFFHQ
jgi:hypothetical protein